MHWLLFLNTVIPFWKVLNENWVYVSYTHVSAQMGMHVPINHQYIPLWIESQKHRAQQVGFGQYQVLFMSKIAVIMIAVIIVIVTTVLSINTRPTQ